MESFFRGLSSFLDTGKKDKTIGEIDLPDIPLWTVWALQQYRRSTSTKECREKYGEVVRWIIDKIRNGKVPNLYFNPNGLVSSNGSDSPVTMAAQSFRARDIFWNSTRCGIMPLDSRYPSTTATQPCRIISTTSTPSQRP